MTREGANAVVVADPDTVSRLKEMGKEIQAGRPVSGIMDELVRHCRPRDA